VVNTPTKVEKQFWQKGLNLVAGLDEAGRGAWAGPLVAAAVIFPINIRRPTKTYKIFIRDSKLLNQKQREKAFQWIIENCSSYGIGVVSEKVIDHLGLTKSGQLVFERALQNLSIIPEHVLVDAYKLQDDISHTAIIHGDRKVFSISAASIVAKVARDKLMLEHDQEYGEYGFSSHMGYGTRLHQSRLKKFGPCALHRFSFRPIHQLMSK